MADPFAVPGFGPPGAPKGTPTAPARPSAWSVSALLLAAGDALAARFGAVTVVCTSAHTPRNCGVLGFVPSICATEKC